MTRHNLREQLNWILSTNASLPLQSSQSAAPFLSQSPTIEAPTIQHNDASVVEPEFEITNGSDASEGGRYQFLCPAIPSRGQKRPPSNEMARLQSGPKSGTKSRLLSQAPPSEMRTPLSQVPQVIGSSLRDQYHAAFDHTGSCMYIVYY